MPDTTTEPTQITLDAYARMFEGRGPLYLREELVAAEEEGYELQWTRIVPMGLHLAVVKDGETVRAMVLDEHSLMEAMATAALATLESGA
jgi:hypothetical protein